MYFLWTQRVHSYEFWKETNAMGYNLLLRVTALPSYRRLMETIVIAIPIVGIGC